MPFGCSYEKIMASQGSAADGELPRWPLLARLRVPVGLPVPGGAGAVQGLRTPGQRGEHLPRHLDHRRLHLLLHCTCPLSQVEDAAAFFIVLYRYCTVMFVTVAFFSHIALYSKNI